MRAITKAGALALLGALALTARAEGLELGDEAPELEVTEWIQGESVTLAENPAKRIRIVQFFNTYDQGCVAASKGLDEVQKELGEKGVDIVAVTTQAADAAREFLEKHPVTYRLAVDQYNNTNAAFMKGVSRLPFAFVIDGDGKVAWMGSPVEGMRGVVEKILDGTYDVEAARRSAELRGALFAALRKGKPDEITKAAEALLENDPDNDLARGVRLQMFQRADDAEGRSAWLHAYAERTNDEAQTQNWIAWTCLSSGDMAWRDVELAAQTSARAVDLSKSEDADILDTRARVLFELGLLEDAIAMAKKSLAIEENDDVKARLTHYEACLEVRKKTEKGTSRKGSGKRR